MDILQKLQNRVIALFPEGTRGDGEKLLQFKGGAKLIAQKYNLKVQPIIIRNARKLFDSQNHTNNRGTIEIEYLESRYAKRGTNWFEQIEKKMNEVFDKEKIK